MKKNLNDDTRFQKQWDTPPCESQFGWMPLIVLILLLALMAYLIFR